MTRSDPSGPVLVLDETPKLQTLYNQNTNISTDRMHESKILKQIKGKKLFSGIYHFPVADHYLWLMLLTGAYWERNENSLNRFAAKHSHMTYWKGRLSLQKAWFVNVKVARGIFQSPSLSKDLASHPGLNFCVQTDEKKKYANHQGCCLLSFIMALRLN